MVRRGASAAHAAFVGPDAACVCVPGEFVWGLIAVAQALRKHGGPPGLLQRYEQYIALLARNVNCIFFQVRCQYSIHVPTRNSIGHDAVCFAEPWLDSIGCRDWRHRGTTDAWKLQDTRRQPTLLG